MRMALEIDPSNLRSAALRADIQNFLRFMARGQWRISEEEDFDGAVLLTLDFRDPLDAADFQRWGDIRRHVRRS